MHVSLDSALGRQRRLNSVGESVLQIAPSAAAAYSLRSLTGGDPKVVRVRRSSDNAESDFTASGVSSGALVDFVGSGNDGFVETWYDQSGNSNDAVQATAGSQPKIVSAGSFLNELDFDGTDDNFELTSVLGMTSAGSIFSVAESGGGNDKIILDNRDSGTDGFRVLRFGDAFEFRWHSAIVDTTTNPGSNTRFLGFSNHDGSDASAAVNGATATTTSNTSVLSVTSKPHIGARSFSSTASFWDGTINELIIYNSDQSSSRVALETNINSHYSIF